MKNNPVFNPAKLPDFRKPKDNCLSFWFPKLKMSEVPVPKTEYMETPVDLIHLMDGKRPEGYDDFLARLKILANKIGYPLFLRAGQGSGKHYWKDTCYVTDEAVLYKHVYQIVEWCLMVDLVGLPINVWAVRELLPVEPVFTAFHGKMPITKERRYFIKDGRAVHHIPYWPLEAFEKHPGVQKELEEIACQH